MKGPDPPPGRNFARRAIIHPKVSTTLHNPHEHDDTNNHGEPSSPTGPGTHASQDRSTSANAHPVKTSALTFFTRPNREELNVFLMRHASAGTRRVNPKLDVKRPLDKDGKRHCLQLAQVLSNLRISFDLIVSSPLKRCLQTAQLVGTEMGYEAKILHAQALEPDADFTQFQRLVHECRSYENVLMVGHNPNLTAFLGQLIALNSTHEGPPAMANVRLRKGSIARVTVERGPAVLKWMLDPRLVRSLYATSTKSSRRKISRK